MERKPHILLVDDEADFLAPVSFWLQSKGYRRVHSYKQDDFFAPVQP
mgnify:CR=1 FL=1